MADDPDDRCDCCDLPRPSCGRDLERRRAAETSVLRAALLRMPGVLPAAFPGTCDGCGERFPAGTPIARDTTATDGGWIAECCLA